MALIVHVLMVADHVITDPPVSEGAASTTRTFDKGRKYEVTEAEARTMIAAGDAAVVEVPHQQGLPRGTTDSARLFAELTALAPPPPATPPPQPDPLPESTPAAPATK